MGITITQVLDLNMKHKTARSDRSMKSSNAQLSWAKTRIEMMHNSRRRRKSLQSIDPQACAVTQKFFRDKKVDVLYELSDMEKPNHDNSNQEMSLQELAGDVLSLLSTAVNLSALRDDIHVAP